MSGNGSDPVQLSGIFAASAGYIAAPRSWLVSPAYPVRGQGYAPIPDASGTSAIAIVPDDTTVYSPPLRWILGRRHGRFVRADERWVELYLQQRAGGHKAADQCDYGLRVRDSNQRRGMQMSSARSFLRVGKTGRVWLPSCWRGPSLFTEA
jgi:hypothetical protein